MDGAGPEQQLLDSPGIDIQRNPYDWSSDGRFILYAILNTNNEDLWVFDTSTSREYPLIQGPLNKSQGQFSPDGKWIAYTLDESGKVEVYTREFLPPEKLADHRTKISLDGGSEPRWRQDGKELFYLGPDGAMMALGIEAGSIVHAAKPVKLFPAKGKPDGFGWPSTIKFAVAANGQKFIMVVEAKPASVSPINVLLNPLFQPPK